MECLVPLRSSEGGETDDVPSDDQAGEKRMWKELGEAA